MTTRRDPSRSVIRPAVIPMVAPVKLMIEAIQPPAIIPNPNSWRMRGRVGGSLPICMAPRMPASMTRVTTPHCVAAPEGAVSLDVTVMGGRWKSRGWS